MSNSTLHSGPNINPSVEEILNANRRVGEFVDSRAGEITKKNEIIFVDASLRDGLQQRDMYQGEIDPETEELWIDPETGKPEGLSDEAKVEIFSAIVATGIKEIEIGHLANKKDHSGARAIFKHIDEQKALENKDYDDLKLQVLLGADPAQVEMAVEVLEGRPRDDITIHVYDSIGAELRRARPVKTDDMTVIDYQKAVEDYEYRVATELTPERAVERVCVASQVALDAGFKHFSVSGEGAVSPRQRPTVVADYHNQVTEYLLEKDADSVNNNLANTFGYTPYGRWNEKGLTTFNDNVKETGEKYPDKIITTSVHTHNDRGTASWFTMAAINAGFDKVEGTLNGWGERSGNVALIDVMGIIVEFAVVDYSVMEQAEIDGEDTSEMFEVDGMESSIFRKRRVGKQIADKLGKWYSSAVTIDEIAETERFKKTAIGSETVYDNGSGPHGEVMDKAMMNPDIIRVYESYESVAFEHASLGCPDAVSIVEADPVSMVDTTVQNTAAGGRIQRAHLDKKRGNLPNDLDARERNLAIVDSRLMVIEAFMTNEQQDDIQLAA